MNSSAGKCHDNARCESIWGRMKEELIYGRYDTKNENGNGESLVYGIYVILGQSDL